MNRSIALPALREGTAATAAIPHGRRRRWAVSANMIVGILLVGILILAAVLAPILAPSPPELMEPANRLQAPSAAHPFGTDNFGRDLFSRVLYGARLAIVLCVATVLVSVLPGLSGGLIAGYRREQTDQVLSRIIDIWLAFPGLLLAIVLVARLGPSLSTTIIALGIVGVPSFYRLARGSTLSAGEMLYVEAARSIGASDTRILWRHILPNIVSPLIVLITLRLGTVLLAAGGLSFIGLGAQPPQPEWGALLAAGRDYMDTAWWLALFPGLAITLTVIGFNLLGDGLRDILAPDVRRGRGTP
ncbi:MAG: ABC transporter permease [Chloroflexi bacterium]|nr:ABC transporter permease [Chloroflexota bacterium]